MERELQLEVARKDHQEAEGVRARGKSRHRFFPLQSLWSGTSLDVPHPLPRLTSKSVTEEEIPQETEKLINESAG